VSRIWVRNHWDGGWITVFWNHLSRVPVPFGELAWDHARAQLPDGGKNAAEEQIADAVRDLLLRANRGPQPATRPKPSKRDRRVAARTRAAGRSLQAVPAPEPDDPPPTAAQAPPEVDKGDDTGATVVPLPVFDAFEEAMKRW
jgi:putative transposase